MVFLKFKKGQLFISSALILLLILIFIYSQETDNFYISSSDKNYLLNNLEYEVCKVGKSSNGSNLDLRFWNLSLVASNYCNEINIYCNLSIVKKSSAPADLSDLNYTHYNYSIKYVEGGFNSSSVFNCQK